MSQCSPIKESPDADKAPAGASLRILVVDDNEASAKMMGWALELLGHEVWIAHDGANALALALDFRPQVVLMDIALPGLNGYELCRIMRAEYGFEHTIFIAHTGWADLDHRRYAREAGFAHYLVKPADMAKLESMLTAHAQHLAKAGAGWTAAGEATIQGG